MADDDKLILHEKEQKQLFFTPMGDTEAAMMLVPHEVTVREHDSIAKKPTGIFNVGMVAGAVIFGLGALTVALASATLAGGAIAAITASSAVAGGLIMGATNNHIKTKRYNAALQQREARMEQAQANGLSPEQAQAMEKEVGNKFQEAEKSRRNIVSIRPYAYDYGR